jgi:peptidoglycan-associated lipoprotein
MTLRHSHFAIVATLAVWLVGCGQKTTKTTESTPPAPTISAPPAEPAPAAPERPAESPGPPPQRIAVSPSDARPRSSGPPQSGDEFTDESALQDIFFGPGRADIERSNARFMKENARWINENPSYLVLIEGHTDARGTSEARLAIADRRAKAAARFLLEEGVSNTRLFTINHGSERPVCVETTDGCAARNRRVHFRVKKQ